MGAGGGGVTGAGTATLRRARPDELPAIAALHARSWKVAYRGILADAFLDLDVDEDRRRLWQDRATWDLEPERYHIVVAERGGALEGFACTILDAEVEWGALLDNLHVDPTLRGRGVGRALVSEAAGWVSALRPISAFHLWVYEANLPARGFYERLGGVVTGREVERAPDGQDVPALRISWRHPQRLTLLA